MESPQEPADLIRLRHEYADRARRLAGRSVYSPLEPAQLFLIQTRQRVLADLLRRLGETNLGGKRLLEVGCGDGAVLIEYLSLGVEPHMLHGIDLIAHRAAAAQRLLPQASISCSDGRCLPYATESFDIVTQYTVFSSVLVPDIKRQMAAEMLRVLRPGGLIIWYDFWLNPRNEQTRGIHPREVVALFPSCRFHVRRATLAPPIARWLAPRAWLPCVLLERLGFLNSHYLIGIQKPG